MSEDAIRNFLLKVKKCSSNLLNWNKESLIEIFERQRRDFLTLRDCLELVADKMDKDQLGNFVAVIWEI